jgi:DNA-binding winged helix-turn-helix (wHTH) protein
MAKKKSDVDKSAAVREILAKDPKTPAKEIIATLGQKGIKISEAYVYMLRSKAKAKGRKEKREQAVAASRSAGLADPVELISGIKALAQKAGGMRTLKKLVDLLAE